MNNLFDPDELHREIGKAIKQNRKAKGWTYAEMSLQSGLSKALLYRAEHGRTNLSIDTISAICVCLETSLSQFFLAIEV